MKTKSQLDDMMEITGPGKLLPSIDFDELVLK